jgi:putative Mg2+ transporter-C (MgtC) family protein
MVSIHTYEEMTFRLLATLLLCSAIGLQRAFAGKAAGLRTHMLVGLGAALMTLASAYAFPGWPGVSRDPTRIAAQIVTGIGFLGGGMIIKEGLTVRGLTTAASLWAVAGVGIAAGSDLIPLAAIGTALMLITLAVLGHVDARIPQQHQTIWELSFALPDPSRLADLRRTLLAECPSAHLIAYDVPAAGRAARFTVQLTAPPRFDIVQVSQTLHSTGAADLQWKADAIGEELG